MTRSKKHSGSVKGKSVAGNAADEVLDALVGQFSDPYAFVRELIQNSLDAGANRVELRSEWSEGVLEIEVTDDGEGMDLRIINEYLLVKFRSSKEDDLTKIGKFGIGFVSLFAMKPFATVVDTGRDGVWHQVRFAEDRSYTLLRMRDPLEGTRVRLRIRCSQDEAAEHCRKTRYSAAKWCRFSRAEVTVEAVGIPEEHPPTSIREAFTVPSPVTVTVVEDGLHAVMGISSETSPKIGLYNGGLTLFEGPGVGVFDIPGVVWRADCPHLEHTLTRDQVILDRHAERVGSRLREILDEQLKAEVEAALRVAAEKRDLERLNTIFASLSPTAFAVQGPCIPLCAGGVASLQDFHRSWWRLAGDSRVYWATETDFQRVPVDESVVLANADGNHHLRWLRQKREVVKLLDVWWRPNPPDPGWEGAPLLARAEELLGEQLLAGAFSGGGARIEGRLVVRQESPWVAQKDEPLWQGTLLVALDHPLWAKLERLPLPLAAPMLARAIQLETGDRSPFRTDWLEGMIRHG